VAGIEALLKNHPKVWPGNVTVQLFFCLVFALTAGDPSGF
jgi:hypothetical protein